jgi:hypothetical protein
MSLMSNYPGGFANGVSIRGVPLAVSHPGSVFWVDSTTGSNGNPGTYQRPFSTIDYAVGRCTANKGDIIFVKPGHTETVIAAAGLDLDVAGIAVIGLGAGSNRPTVNFTTATTADMDVDAANITVYNILFTGGIDALAGPIVVIADANADRLLIDGHFHNGAAAAGADSAIALIGMDNPVIRNFKIVGNFAVSAIDCRTTAVVDLEIHNGYIWTKNAADLCIKDTVTGSTGKIGPDLEFMLTDNAANITEAVTGATFHMFDPVYVCNLVNEKAMLINWTASTDA